MNNKISNTKRDSNRTLDKVRYEDLTICSFERPRDLKESPEDVNIELAVAMRQGVTPVPISNTKVKTLTADGTWWVTAWESRWLPLFFC